LLLLLLVIGGGVAYSTGFIKFDAGVHASSCTIDSEIAPETRRSLDQRAIAFTQAILTQNGSLAYAMMTKEAQASVPADRFGPAIVALVHSSGPFEVPQVTHTYFVRSTGSGSDARTICGTLANDEWASVEIKPGLDQGHVVVSAKARNNDWAFTVWLLPDQNDWRVQYFHMGPSTVVGLTPEMLLQRARAERDGGHMFNAAMLYAGIQGFIDFGPAFQLGIVQPVHDDLGKFKLPPELSGKRPFVWKLGGVTYTVAQVGIIGIAQKLGLMFILPQKSWAGNSEADISNRAFLSAFMAAHPDYSRSFSFLVARALKPDNSGGFGTVYENGKGFDTR
jgi:hypothetical protein